jgi:hypothetical protein
MSLQQDISLAAHKSLGENLHISLDFLVAAAGDSAHK